MQSRCRRPSIYPAQFSKHTNGFRQAQPADGRWTAPVAHPRRNYRKCDLRPRSRRRRRAPDRIVKLGFSLALDDFGTVAGALQHLASLPVSEIKIDRSFVSGMDSDRRKSAIIRGLIVTGRAMGVDIVAEGVETEAEATQLRLMGAQFRRATFGQSRYRLPNLSLSSACSAQTPCKTSPEGRRTTR